MMAEGRFSLSSDVSFSENDQTEDISSFLRMTEDRNRRRFKWVGSLDELKFFVTEILKLNGNWSFTTNNGGFNIFKADSVTLCFYPGTETLNVQGAMQDIFRKKLAKLVIPNGKDEDEGAVMYENDKDAQSQNGGLVKESESLDHEASTIVEEVDQVGCGLKCCKKHGVEMTMLRKEILEIRDILEVLTTNRSNNEDNEAIRTNLKQQIDSNNELRTEINAINLKKQGTGTRAR